MQTNLALTPHPHILFEGFHSHLISGLFGWSTGISDKMPMYSKKNSWF